MKGAARPQASRRRVSLTVLGTLTVVLVEFALLHSVYRYGDTTRQAQVIVARVQGQISAATPEQAHRSAASAQAQLADLPAGGTQRRVALHAARQFEREADPAALQRLRLAVGRLSDALRSDNERAAVVADLIYAGLLILASVGWMSWFRRLVARHRKLQQDVTEANLQARNEQRMAALIRNAADLVVLSTDGLITFATSSSRAVLGLEPNALLGRPLLDLVEVGERHVLTASVASLRPDEDRDIRVRMTHASGRVLDVEGTMTDLSSDPSVGALVITLRDVTTRVDLERQLQHQAFYDALTGLGNRQLFTDRLSHALARASRGRDESVAVLFCDLDEFKNVNDSLGHRVGDEVLTLVGRRAGSVICPADTAARLGGDEFAILLEDTDVETASRVAQDLLDALSTPFEVDGHVLNVRASIGLAMSGGAAITGEEVLRNADVAMYLAKGRGKGVIARYDGELHSMQLARLVLREELEHAIAKDELTVHYQPIVDLQDCTVAGFEALVRWPHPSRGMLGPVEFIPIAEKSGLIADLGRLVLRAACRAGADFNVGTERDVYVTVNVSAKQISRSGFIDEVRSALEDAGLPGRNLVVEITESVLLNDLDETITLLTELRRIGVRIAVDDFGTGYSSLAYLRDLPLDILKVDKAFIDRVAIDPNHATLTSAILAMSRCLDLVTVAEGVETEAQAAWLTRSRCAYGQGFVWSRPVPWTEAVGLLESRMSVVRTEPSAVAAV